MILRRLAENLRQQNWTAIVIEFVLLVVGVFLGIQVSNWNTERETERKAQVFTERLREDLRVEVWRFKALNLYYQDVIDNAIATLRDLEGDKPLSNEAMATEIYGSSLYLNAKNEGQASEYRRAFRALLPVPVQIAVSSQCGDREAMVLDYTSIEHPIGYPCKTGLPAADIDAAAAALRAAPQLPTLLRLRIMNVGTVVGVQLMSREVIQGMAALAPGQLTPEEERR